jgi:hypothetical protein
VTCARNWECCLHAHIASGVGTAAKTDAGLVPLCPLASMVPGFSGDFFGGSLRAAGRPDPVGEISKPIPQPGPRLPQLLTNNCLDLPISSGLCKIAPEGLNANQTWLIGHLPTVVSSGAIWTEIEPGFHIVRFQQIRRLGGTAVCQTMNYARRSSWRSSPSSSFRSSPLTRSIHGD